MLKIIRLTIVNSIQYFATFEYDLFLTELL